MQRDMFASPHAHPQLEPLQAIPAPDPFAVDGPTFPPQQDPDSQIAESGAGMREITNAQPQRGLILRLTLPIPGGPTKLGQPTGPRTTHLERPVKPLRQFPGAGRASDFFSQGLRQHVLVQQEIGHQPLQPAVLLFQLPKPAQLTHAQICVLLFPGIQV